MGLEYFLERWPDLAMLLLIGIGVWKVSGWRSAVDHRLNALEESAMEFRNSLDGFREALDSFRETLAGFGATLNEFRNTLNGFGIKLDSFGNRLDDFGNRLDSFGNRLDDFGNRLDGFGNRLDSFGNRLDDLGNTLDGFGNTLNGFGNKLDGFGNRFDSFGNRLDSFGNQLDIVVRALTEVPAKSNSPHRLNEMGFEISEMVNAKDWVERHIDEVRPQVEGKSRYDLQNICDDYVAFDKFSETEQEALKEAAYEKGQPMSNVLWVVALELRDALLEEREAVDVPSE